MTFKDAVKKFMNKSYPFHDYWEMQLSWSGYVDSLNRDGQITDKQYFIWGNPCTPETFNKFNQKLWNCVYKGA